MPLARNLVVVRCGDASLHPAWLGRNRNWDLAVSYFGADDRRSFPGARHVHRFKGGKWDGIHAFFSEHPDCVDDYDHFWLPDDDISADAASIDLMFDIVRRMGFELAQPSLARGSFASHLVSLRNPLFVYRNVNLIEIMVPVLDRRLLRTMLPLFASTRSGFGIDFVWQRFTTDPRTRAAIIDCVSVTHTRPVGGPLRNVVAAGRDTVDREQERFLAPYGEVVKTEITLGGQLRIGVRLCSPKIAATCAALGWATRPFGNKGFSAPLSAPRFLVWIARNWWGNMKEDGWRQTTLSGPVCARGDDA